MKKKIIKNEDGEKLTVTFPDTPIVVDYKLGQEVWFFLQNSLEVKHGRVVGFFLFMNDINNDSDRTYYYQLEYYVEMKDGSMEMRLGNANKDEMGTDEKTVKEKFKPIRKIRVEAAIRQGEIELGGAIAEKETHSENARQLKNEIERLKGLR